MNAADTHSSSGNDHEHLATIAGAFLSDNIISIAKPIRHLLGRPKASQSRSMLHPLRQSLAGASASDAKSQPHDRWNGSISARESQRKLIKHSLKPQGPGNNDRSTAERLINVVTSMPFIIVGLHTRRARRTPEGKRFGSTMVSVGAAATAYHAARGDLRCALRKLDYWTIALASTQMVRALFPSGSPKLRTLNAASWALMPFQPTAVSTANIGIAEVEFLRASWRDRKLAQAYKKHVAIGGLGLCCFALEDVAISHGHHFVHSLWHLNACYAVASTNAMMRKREECNLGPATAT